MLQLSWPKTALSTHEATWMQLQLYKFYESEMTFKNKACSKFDLIIRLAALYYMAAIWSYSCVLIAATQAGKMGPSFLLQNACFNPVQESAWSAFTKCIIFGPFQWWSYKKINKQETVKTFRKHKLKTLVGLLSVLQTQWAFFAGSWNKQVLLDS